MVVLAILCVIGYVFYSGVHSLVTALREPMDASASDKGMEEVTVEDNQSDNKILLVDVSGIISSEMWDRSGQNMVSSVRDQLKEAKEDKSIKAVILRVDSPGGEVLASDEIYKYITQFQKETSIPVIASMGTLAASGGYYVSAPCQWIVANELTITGSIGVIMHGFNYRGLMDKVGVSPVVFKSGKFKDMMSPDRLPSEVSLEEKAMVQGMIDETFQKFKKIVREGRDWSATRNAKSSDHGQALAKDWESLADGRILSGNQAFANGFVDELGNFKTAVERAKKIAGVKEADLVRYQRHLDFSSLFRMFGKSQTPAIKLDLGFDLPRLPAGRLYFLYSPVVQ